jgi:hypothetical protein
LLPSILITFLKTWKFGNWCMKMVLVSCVVEFVWSFRLFTMKLINENICSHWRGIISRFLSRLIHEFLGLASAIILIIFFCNVNIILLLDELPSKNYFILHYRVVFRNLFHPDLSKTHDGTPQIVASRKGCTKLYMAISMYVVYINKYLPYKNAGIWKQNFTHVR